MRPTAPPTPDEPGPAALPAQAGARLDPAQVEAIGAALEQIRQEVLDSRGARDAAYIRRVIRVRRELEVASRLLLLAARWRPAWVLGTAGLAVAKVLDNMEIGHNVLHGQWDWMRDPAISSHTFEWDHCSPAEQWKRAHNEEHHVHTNVLGKDNDLGYGILRVDEGQPWRARHLAQPLWNLVNACVFEYGIAVYDIGLGDQLRAGEGLTPELREDLRRLWAKSRRQLVKDFVLHPLLSGPGWRSTLTADLTANLLRNLWSHSVIMCGHFPEGVETFEQDRVREDETRAEWYVRQMLGSANISGPPLLHLMTGNLSHQIEHHLFPDLPSNRYRSIAPRVRRVFEEHGLRYHSAPMPAQVASAWHKVVRLSLPEGWAAQTSLRTLPRQLRDLRRRAREAGREWRATRATRAGAGTPAAAAC